MLKYYGYDQDDGYGYRQVHLFRPHGWKDRQASLAPALPQFTTQCPAAGSGGDQLLTTESTSPFQIKQSGQRGQLYTRTITCFDVLNHKLALLPLGLSHSQVSGITLGQLCWVRCVHGWGSSRNSSVLDARDQTAVQRVTFIAFILAKSPYSPEQGHQGKRRDHHMPHPPQRERKKTKNSM